MTAYRVEDEAACVRLCVDFANYLDAQRYEQVLELFTDDATLDRMGDVSYGRAEIARFLASRPTQTTTRHVCTNIRVSFDGAAEAQASGVCYVLFFQGSGGSEDSPAQLSGPPSVVEYHDTFRQTPAGWRIHARRIRMAIRA